MGKGFITREFSGRGIPVFPGRLLGWFSASKFGARPASPCGYPVIFCRRKQYTMVITSIEVVDNLLTYLCIYMYILPTYYYIYNII